MSGSFGALNSKYNTLLAIELNNQAGIGTSNTLQQVVTASDVLNGSAPTTNQVIQYDGANVIWNDLPSVAPTLQDVLDNGNTADGDIFLEKAGIDIIVKESVNYSSSVLSITDKVKTGGELPTRDNPQGVAIYSLYQDRLTDGNGGTITSQSQISQEGFTTYIQDINDPTNPNAVYNTFSIITSSGNGQTFVGANDNNDNYFQFTGNNTLELHTIDNTTTLSPNQLILDNGGDTMTINNTSITAITGIFSITGDAQVNITANADSMNIQGQNVTVTATNDTIALNANNLTCKTYALPICLSDKFGGAISSYVGNNSWQLVYYKLWENIPIEFFSGGVYASTQWKMEFSINFYNLSNNNNDNGFAFYINFVDEQLVEYNGWQFNQTTPYAQALTGNSYSQTSSQLQAFTYTDFYDFSGLVGTSDTNIPPLTIQLFMNADKDHDADFKWSLTLTKTNILT